MSISATFPTLRARHESLTRAALRDAFKEQEADVVVAGRRLGDEWDVQLARAIYTRQRNTAADVALRVAAALKGDFDPDVMDAWLSKNAEFAAVGINASTRAALADVGDDKGEVFAALVASGATTYARSLMTTAANFGALDAARSGGAGSKTWTGGTTRHGGMNGETVPLSENFSNGLAWPGDPAGGASDLANCGCSVTFN